MNISKSLNKTVLITFRLTSSYHFHKSCIERNQISANAVRILILAVVNVCIFWYMAFFVLTDIIETARGIAGELCDKARLKAGQIVIIGCSTSEIAGFNVGTNSNAEIGAAVFDGFYDVFYGRGIFIAAQCCEHLNRAVITEREAAACWEIVNVIPVPKAGGSFAAAAYAKFRNPVALYEIRADAGLDIGNTLIGMHLKKVAVPLRLDISCIGKATVIAARTRPPLIGGARAIYDEKLL